MSVEDLIIQKNNQLNQSAHISQNSLDKHIEILNKRRSRKRNREKINSIYDQYQRDRISFII